MKQNKAAAAAAQQAEFQAEFQARVEAEAQAMLRRPAALEEGKVLESKLLAEQEASRRLAELAAAQARLQAQAALKAAALPNCCPMLLLMWQSSLHTKNIGVRK